MSAANSEIKTQWAFMISQIHIPPFLNPSQTPSVLRSRDLTSMNAIHALSRVKEFFISPENQGEYLSAEDMMLQFSLGNSQSYKVQRQLRKEGFLIRYSGESGTQSNCYCLNPLWKEHKK